MSTLTYAQDFWQDKIQKRELIRFVKDIHNLDLSAWDEAAYWDRQYQPFSFFDNEKMIANVCVYSLDMIVKGKQCRIAQISGVGTDPAYRRRGLSYELSQKALNWAEDKHEFCFLFADDEAIPLYTKCGFRPIDEVKTIITVKGDKHNSQLRQLDMNSQSDRQFVFEQAQNRSPVSDDLGVLNPWLEMFWCMYFLKEQVYYVEPLDCLVLMERQDTKLVIADIIGTNIPSFEVLYTHICQDSDTEVEFLFMPDKLNITGYQQKTTLLPSGTFVKGAFPFESGCFQFPLTAHA